MNSYINNEFQEILEKSAKAGTRVPGFGDNEIMSQTKAEYYDMYGKIMKNMNYLKLTIILGIKGFSWRTELEQTFDISNKDIQGYKEMMKDKGFMLTQPFIDLPEPQFLATIRTRSNSFYAQRDKITVMALSPEGEEFVNRSMADVGKLINNRTDLRHQYDQIQRKTLAFQEAIKKVMQQEDSVDRRIKYPDGTIVYRDGIKHSNFKKELAQAGREAKLEYLQEKKQQNLLTDKESNQLILIEKQCTELTTVDNSKQLLTEARYEGKHSHLTSDKLDLIINGELHYDEESGNYYTTKEMEDNLNKSTAKEDIQQQHDEYSREKDSVRFYSRGFHDELPDKVVEPKQVSDDVGMDFLNSL